MFFAHDKKNLKEILESPFKKKATRILISFDKRFMELN